MKTYGQRLNEIIIIQNISVKEFANIVSASPETIKKYIKGNSLPCERIEKRIKEYCKKNKLIPPVRGNSEYSKETVWLINNSIKNGTFNELKDREKEVLILRMGIRDGNSLSLEEIGRVFHVTRERIRQIEAKAIRKLKNPERINKTKYFFEK